VIIEILLILVGLVAILVGADKLIDGSSAIAKRFGLSDLVIGLTVVAFGTSTPELVISVISSIDGNAGLAIGNIVGSNIFNLLMIIGVTAMIRPMSVERGLLSKDIAMVLLSSLVLLAMGNGVLLDGDAESMLTRVDGIVLLLLFAVFMRYTFARAKSEPIEPTAAKNDSEMPLWRAIVYSLGGLALLVVGGDFFVDAASDLAKSLGVSDTIIGLTIAALGSSLPELATSVTAAIKGKPGLAIGNVIGSCIVNVFLVLGCSATIRPLGFGAIGNLDLMTLTLASVLFLLFGRFFGKHRINRVEGAIIVACYLIYMTILLILQT
jgi:cation:H+ antiporter